MNISGKVKKDIYRQTGACSLLVNLTTFSYLDEARLIFSGSGQSPLNFLLRSGKIYGSANNFIGTYSNTELLSFSGNFSSGKYDIYLDGNPRIIGNYSPLNYLDSFIFSGNSSGINWDFYLNGEKPNLGVDEMILFNTGDSSFTGVISNNGNQLVKIYSGEFIGDPSSYSVNIPTGLIYPNQSLTYTVYPSGSKTLGLGSIDSLLKTNFGDLVIEVPISGVSSIIDNYSFDLSGPNEVPYDYPQLYILQYSTKSGQSSFKIGLENISGSGVSYINIPVSGYVQVPVSGEITGCGNLYSSLVNVSGTGSGGNLGNTGIIPLSYVVSKEICPTGQITVSKSLLFTGQATGAGYTGAGYKYVDVPITLTFEDSDNGVKITSYDQTGAAITNPCFASSPTLRVPSSGHINYNTPSSGMGNDLLYIRTQYQAIVYGFHYSDQSSLVSYLNANTGTHGVSASYTGGNTIYLESVPGLEDATILLAVDQDNNGNMSVSSNYLSGGYTSGIGSSVFPINTGSWITNNSSLPITGSGFFSDVFSGYLTGSTSVIDDVKPFTSLWSLESGSNSVDYTQINNLVGSFGLLSADFSGVQGNIYLRLSYNSTYSTLGDVSKLWVSGTNQTSGIYKTIEITGGLI